MQRGAWRGVVWRYKNRNIYIYIPVHCTRLQQHGVAMRGNFIDRGCSNYEGVLLRYLYITIQTLTQKGNKINITWHYITVV